MVNNKYHRRRTSHELQQQLYHSCWVFHYLQPPCNHSNITKKTCFMRKIIVIIQQQNILFRHHSHKHNCSQLLTMIDSQLSQSHRKSSKNNKHTSPNLNAASKYFLGVDFELAPNTHTRILYLWIHNFPNNIR